MNGPAANESTFRLWTEALSAYAVQVDLLTLGFMILLTALTLPVMVLLVVFVVRYREGRPANRKRAPARSRRLEWSWAIIPFVLSLYFFWQAAELYADLAEPPEDALVISVIGKQWMWKFQHPGGQRELDTLHVPVGVPVKLRMISQDVIHSLYLPVLRIKHDVLPHRYTEIWFQADRPGRHHIFCAEFCGTAHSRMTGELIVMQPEAYRRWLDEREPDESLVSRGEKLFRAYGCSGCHGEGGTVDAPSLAGVWGRPVPLREGGTVVADASYVRDSILFPARDLVAGYRPIMPSYRGQISEGDLVELVAYIQSLSEPDRTPRAGQGADAAAEEVRP